MEHIRQEIRIEAPVDHVWTYLCDTSHWSDWMPRGEAYDFSGPYDRAGTTYRQKFRMMGFEMKQTSTVVEVEPLKLIHEHTDDGPMDTLVRLEAEGDGTRLIMEADYDLPGYIPGVIKNLWTKPYFERQTRHMLGELKAITEATVPVHA